jgi:hypothetical protein
MSKTRKGPFSTPPKVIKEIRAKRLEKFAHDILQTGVDLTQAAGLLNVGAIEIDDVEEIISQSIKILAHLQTHLPELKLSH